MTEHLQMLAALCRADGATGLVLALFLAGLVGSAVHCAPMCGPFVLAQVAGAMARIDARHLCERQRLSAGLLLPYHLGRVFTYALLGAVAAGSGAAFAHLWFARHLPSLLLAAAAGFFLMQAMQRLRPEILARRGGHRPRPVPWAGLIARAAARIDRTRPAGGLLMGVVLGFLPCGFLYAALAVAASGGSAGMGAAAMAAFAIGTVPSLAVLGLAGQAGGRVWRQAMVTAGPWLLLINAAILASMAAQRWS